MINIVLIGFEAGPGAALASLSAEAYQHLDGVNLSRAWMLEGIASALPPSDPRQRVISVSAGAHREAGLEGVSAEHYAGSHWLGSFATYLITRRGIAGG